MCNGARGLFRNCVPSQITRHRRRCVDLILFSTELDKELTRSADDQDLTVGGIIAVPVTLNGPKARQCVRCRSRPFATGPQPVRQRKVTPDSLLTVILEALVPVWQ